MGNTLISSILGVLMLPGSPCSRDFKGRVNGTATKHRITCSRCLLILRFVSFFTSII